MPLTSGEDTTLPVGRRKRSQEGKRRPHCGSASSSQRPGEHCDLISVGFFWATLLSTSQMCSPFSGLHFCLERTPPNNKLNLTPFIPQASFEVISSVRAWDSPDPTDMLPVYTQHACSCGGLSYSSTTLAAM